MGLSLDFLAQSLPVAYQPMLSQIITSHIVNNNTLIFINYLRGVVESILLKSAEPTSRESDIFSGKGASLESFDITVITA